MPDALKMTTVAYPAVEFLCLVGLQRARPALTGKARVFDYFTWSVPLPISLLPVATTGQLGHVGAVGYRFENSFRTDQRKHKAFLPATPIGDYR
jgi:CRISPR-associated protein Csb3